MPRFCSSCGAEMADSAAFCPKCGRATAAQNVGAGPTAGPVAAPTVSSGLQDNVAGLLAYLFIPAIVFLFVEPYSRNRFVRFHSFQAIFTGIFSIVVHAVLTMIPFIGWILIVPFSVFMFVVFVVCMIKAYQLQMFRLPVVGEMAEKQANS